MGLEARAVVEELNSYGCKAPVVIGAKGHTQNIIMDLTDAHKLENPGREERKIERESSHR